MRTRTRLAALAVALFALAALVAAGAQAQGASSVLLFAPGVSGGTPVSVTNAPVAVEGQLTVSYHGDAGTGCAADGVCAYSGTIVLRPRSGSFAVETYRRRGRPGRLAVLAFEPVQGGYMTAAVVQRSPSTGPGGTCVDAQNPGFSTSTVQLARDGLGTIALLAPGGSLLSTRCAGPLDGDLRSASPAATVPLRRLERGEIRIDLSGTRPFAAHGFAGTIASTIVLRLGKPHSSTTNVNPPGAKTARIRTVTEKLSVERISGAFRTAVSGSPDPVVCRLLDSCGTTGTLSLAAGPRVLSAEVIATGRASHPYGDFLTALGLRSGPRPPGISVALSVFWTARVTGTFTEPGATCTDTAPGGGLLLALGVPRGGGKLVGRAVSLGPWRTRCPGPSFATGATMLSASAPAGALRHARFSIALRPSAPFGDDGYLVSPTGRLSLVLRRGRISQFVQSEPTG